MKYEYKTVIYKEGLFSSILLGSAKVDPERLSETLNQYGRQGWRVVTMERESRRAFLIFRREAFLVVLERVIGN